MQRSWKCCCRVRRRMRRAGAQAGFTLVEILVVITIIGLIMALVGPRVLNYLGESKAKAAKIQIESFSSALDLYYLDLGRYPDHQRRPGRADARQQRAGLERAVFARRRGAQRSLGPHLCLSRRRASARRTKSFRSAPTARRAAVARRPTSPAARAETRCVDGERGFALIEILCVLAIIGLLAAIILPAIPRATSRAKLESYAVETAAMLKADRNAALRRQVQVATQVDAPQRAIRSGVTGRIMRLPNDVIAGCAAGVALRGPRRRPLDRFFSVGDVVRRHRSRWRGRAWDMKFASTG